ncbi:MAG: hypothetical protein ABIR24_08260 [Verrucomicrobiota bacterium]
MEIVVAGLLLGVTEMNKFTLVLFRSLGFKRPKPKTRLGRCLRRAERLLSILGLLYVGLLLFPQVLFAHSVTAQGVTIYARQPLPTGTTACIARVKTLVEQTELSVPGRREQVFVCNARWLFRVFRPFGFRVFAVSIPWTDKIFIADADLSKDISRREATEFNSRSFSGVVAHEITHGLIRHRLGLFRGMRLPDWVAEGYCDFVAHESSFPEAEGLRRLAADEPDVSTAFRYFTYRQMVRYLIEDQHLSFAEVVEHAKNFATIKAATRKAIKDELHND